MSVDVLERVAARERVDTRTIWHEDWALILALTAEVRALRAKLSEVRDIVAREDLDGDAADAVTVRMVLLKDIDAAMAREARDQ